MKKILNKFGTEPYILHLPGKGLQDFYKYISFVEDKPITYNENDYPQVKNIEVDRNVMKIDDKTVTTNEIKNNLTNSTYLFALNNNGTSGLYAYIKLYYLKIYDGDALVRDYIPVIDSNSRPCLFDKVVKEC